MATIDHTITRIGSSPYVSWVVTWEGLGGEDDGAPLEMPGWADRSVQITGTFDTGTCTIEGSNDGTNYELLTDGQGNDISKTSADLEGVAEITRYLRPHVTGGGGSCDIDVTVVIAGYRPW